MSISASFFVQLIIFFLALAEDQGLNGKELAKKIKQGDHKAFQRFFDAHHEALFRFLVGKGISGPTAEDLIQKAFIYIWENRTKIQPEKSLKAYLFRIGYTRMLNHIRDNSKFDGFESASHSQTTVRPDDHLQEEELRKAIDRAIQQMPEKRGMVFELCFVQEFTYKEAADALDVSRKTVENHMGLALKDIRKALQEFNPGKYS